MKIAEFSVKNHQFTIVLFIMVLLLGLNALFNMPRGEDPVFNAPIYVVTVIYPGTSPNDMEELIVDPLEDALGELEDIKKIDTNCHDGVSITEIEFSYGVEVLTKYNDIIREVSKLRPDLPEGILRVEIIRAQSTDVNVFQHALVSKSASFKEMEKQAEKLKDELEKLKELKNVVIQACPAEQIKIEIDLEKMAQNQMGLNQVLGLINANNINVPGGSIDIGSKKINIKTTSSFETIGDIRNTIVRTTPEGRIVHLKDIATVRFDYEEETHRARFNGERTIWILTKQKDAKNIIQVSKEVYPILEKFASELPPGMRLETSFDQAKSVDRRLSGLGRDFLVAVFLVLLTLLPLGYRASFVVMISIPLSLSIGVALLDLMGYTLNQLSIVGMVISLGLLVDDSIVIVENIERFMRMGYSRTEAAIAGTKQIGIAVVGCTATLILAFLPLAFLPEATGLFIRSMPLAVILTVIASLFVSLTIIPFLSSMILKKEEKAEGNFFFRIFKKYLNQPYQKILRWTFRHPAFTLALALLIFLSSLCLVPYIGFSLFPPSEKPIFMIDVELPLGSNMKKVDEIVTQIEDRMLRDSLVVSVSANVGKGNPRVYYNIFQHQIAANFGQLFIRLQPEMQMPEIVAYTDRLKKEFAHFPGAKISVKMFQQGPPIEAPIDIQVFGENLEELRRIAIDVEEIMKKTEGTIYVENPLRTQKTDLEVVINKDKAGLLGIPLAEVARTVRLGVAGLDIGEFRNEEGEEYKLNVSVPQNKNEALTTFSKMYITSLSGNLVPLSQIAKMELQTSPSFIQHYNKARFTNVSAYTRTGYNTSALTDQIIDKLERYDFPEGYRFQAAGERASQEESFGGMTGIVIIAFFLLLAILVLEFRTFKSTLIVLSVVPLGIIGSLTTLFLIGETLSFVATIGMVALVGIEIKNSIFLVDYTNQLREKGMPLEEAILEGSETRFLPIFLTTLTAIGGLIPLVLENSPLISPLAWVLIGGLVSSLFLSRIVTPLLYKLLPPKVRVK
ncbi:MAG TPA: efflux RND transporter permease subunit [Bacteroidetes bacterium]|nr:efflux RND transporter permease subunit [Bacteroidota bacterium]